MLYDLILFTQILQSGQHLLRQLNATSSSCSSRIREKPSRKLRGANGFANSHYAAGRNCRVQEIRRWCPRPKESTVTYSF